MTETTPGAARRPKASRPEPAEYFKDADSGSGLLDWGSASARITAAMNYWVCTVRPGGRPHCMPVWAVWIDETLLFSTSQQSRKARNLSANPNVSVHLESGDQAVIFEGIAREVHDPSLINQFVEQYNRKYSWDLTLEFLAGGGVFAVTPRVAFAWLDSHEPGFSGSATRWQFEDK